MKAIFDIGSNTILCLIAEYRNQILHVQYDGSEVVKLSQGLNENGKISEAALSRAEIALKKFDAEIKKRDVKEIHVFATAVARRASNTNQLIDLVNKTFNQSLVVLSGEQEAQFSFFGCRENLPESDFAVLDIGGASTELVVGDKTQIRTAFSFDIGAVTLTEAFHLEGIAKKSDLEDCRKHIQDHLKRWPGVFATVSQLIAVAGTPTEIVRVAIGGFDPEKINHFSLEHSKLQREINKLAAQTTSERIHFSGYNEKRADVILAGCLLLSEFLIFTQQSSAQVSTWGLRLGALKKVEGFNQ